MKPVRDFESFQEYAKYKRACDDEVYSKVRDRLKKALSQMFPKFMDMCSKSDVTFSCSVEDYAFFVNFPGSNEICFDFGVEESGFTYRPNPKQVLVLRRIDNKAISRMSSYEQVEEDLLDRAASFYEYVSK